MPPMGLWRDLVVMGGVAPAVMAFRGLRRAMRRDLRMSDRRRLIL
jgi:hypothetical protein